MASFSLVHTPKMPDLYSLLLTGYLLCVIGTSCFTGPKYTFILLTLPPKYPSVIFPISSGGNSILPKILEAALTSLLDPHPVLPQILSLCLQNIYRMQPLYSYCYHPGHSPGLLQKLPNWSPCFHPCIFVVCSWHVNHMDIPLLKSLQELPISFRINDRGPSLYT